MIEHEGLRGSFEYREGGRDGFGKSYLPEESKGIVGRHGEEEDVSGWAYYLGESKDGQAHGRGVLQNFDEGEVFVGEFEGGWQKEGVVSCLNEDNSRSLFNER